MVITIHIYYIKYCNYIPVVITLITRTLYCANMGSGVLEKLKFVVNTYIYLQQYILICSYL